jgi:hypothetical protein
MIPSRRVFSFFFLRLSAGQADLFQGCGQSSVFPVFAAGKILCFPRFPELLGMFPRGLVPSGDMPSVGVAMTSSSRAVCFLHSV